MTRQQVRDALHELLTDIDQHAHIADVFGGIQELYWNIQEPRKEVKPPCTQETTPATT